MISQRVAPSLVMNANTKIHENGLESRFLLCFEALRKTTYLLISRSSQPFKVYLNPQPASAEFLRLYIFLFFSFALLFFMLPSLQGTGQAMAF